MSKASIVDFLSFRKQRCGVCKSSSGGAFIVKELCIVDLSTGACSHFLFRPPQPSKNSKEAISKENVWLTKQFHGLQWDDGYIPYNRLDEILLSHLTSYDTVYVKGEEKASYLRGRGITANIVDLGQQDCPSLRNRGFWCKFPSLPCIQHSGTTYVCARVQAMKLYTWLHGKALVT